MRQIYQALLNQYNISNRSSNEEIPKNLNRGVFSIDESSGIPTQTQSKQVKRNVQEDPNKMKKDTNENRFWGMTFGTDSF